MHQLAAMGGTELMIARVRRAYPRLTEQVQLVGSRPRDVAHDPTKPKIVWLQDLIDDPSLKCLVDPTYRSVFNAIVCVSAWQQDQFARAGIPYSQTTVIKNSCEPLVPTWPKPVPEDGKLRLIYHSTPHRGLAVLSAAAAELANVRQDWHLDVYSSTKIYGWPDAQDAQFEPLYQQLRDNPCVTYHGTVDQGDGAPGGARRASVGVSEHLPRNVLPLRDRSVDGRLSGHYQCVRGPPRNVCRMGLVPALQ